LKYKLTNNYGELKVDEFNLIAIDDSMEVSHAICENNDDHRNELNEQYAPFPNSNLGMLKGQFLYFL